MSFAAERLIETHNNRRSILFKREGIFRKPSPIKKNNTYLERHSPSQVRVNGKTIKQEYYPTDTSLAEEFAWDTMAGLSGNVGYGPSELRQLYENGYHPAFFGKDMPPSNNVLATKATYVLPRLVATKHIPLLADADIHFTDNAKDFYNEINGENVNTFIADKRARVYRIDIDKNERTHITYLLRHSYVENYIDAFELVSFLAFTEFFKNRILLSNFDFQGEEGKKLEKNLNILGFVKDSIILWASKQKQAQNQGIFLLPSEQFSLNPPWKIYSETNLRDNGKLWEHDRDVIQDAIGTIKTSIKRYYREMPNHLIMGNDFSIPLMATLGLFNNGEIERIFELASPDKPKPEQQTLNKGEIEKEISKIKNNIDKETIRKFRVYQYLNLYQGANPEIIYMKTLLYSTVNNMKIRIVSAGATGLGSPVDLLDFSNLSKELIMQIKHPKIRKLILNLYEKKAQIMSLSYPLGENVYPLIRLFYQKLGIKNIGFFGKVGSVIDTSGRGSKRGRVVMPEFYTRIGEPDRETYNKFKNSLNVKDTFLLDAADRIETIIATNSVLLQSEQDILTYGTSAEKSTDKQGVLLDSESYWYQEACSGLGIDSTAAYYVSDNTRTDGSLDEDMTRALSAEGTLAVLETPLTILNKWFTNSE